MHGNRKVSTKNLARQIGAKSVEPCTPEVASRHSGYLVGGTSPFGLRRAMPVFIEASILDLPKILINGGRRGYLVGLEPQLCVRLLGARPVPVSYTHLDVYKRQAIDMTRHQVPAQAIIGAQCLFQVDRPQCFKPGRLVERLGGDVHGEAVGLGAQRGDCHAGPVERNAVAWADVGQVARRANQGQAFAVAGRVAQGENSSDTA